MSLRQTYLLTAPSNTDNPFGQTMTSTDLVKGLRRANPALSVPDPSLFEWYPLKSTGHTTLWLGEPFKGKKITVFRLGAVPEWTQLDPNGLVIARGWRSVLSRAIRSGAVSKHRIEHIFKINMDVCEKDDACPQCRREGLGTILATCASGFCDTHDTAFKQIQRAKREKKDAPLALADAASHVRRKPVSVIVGATK